MRKCAQECRLKRKCCEEEECRYWIDYEDDLNCSLVAVEKHGNMTLREVADRLHVSFVRIKQIEDKALKKLTKVDRIDF